MPELIRTLIAAISALLVVAASGPVSGDGQTAPAQTSSSSQAAKAKATAPALTPDAVDRLLAPVALYPDQLLAQILLCAANPGRVATLAEWLASNQALKGADLQDAAVKSGFDGSFAALVVFPDVVDMMAGQLEWTRHLGEVFSADKTAVFDSIQRLRAKASKAGTLKTTAQQEVETRTTSSGQQVIVIEPANPQIVYVPQYNPQTVYTTSSTVVVQESSNSGAVAAGVIGFAAGIAIGAAIDNDYYYGPYGARGGAYMYNDAWDDWYDDREDAREDWQDHREDLADERGDRASKAQEQRTERTGERQGTASTTKREGTASTKREGATSAATTKAGSTYESRGHSQAQDRARPTTTQERSGKNSDAFSGYSGGKSQRAASSRGSSSRSSSRSRGGGGRRR